MVVAIITKIIKLVIIATFFIFFSLILVPNPTAILLLTIKLQAAYRIVEIVKNAKFEMSNESTEIKWVSIKEAKNLINKEDKAMTRMLKKYENYLKSNS